MHFASVGRASETGSRALASLGDGLSGGGVFSMVSANDHGAKDTYNKGNAKGPS